jgi:hypothetical protein
MEKFIVTEIKGEYRVLSTSRALNEIADTYHQVAIFSNRKSAIAYKYKLLVEEGIVFECQQYDDFFGILYQGGKFEEFIECTSYSNAKPLILL